MNELAVLREAEPRKILQVVSEKEVPGTMSYLSKDKWHAAKIMVTGLEGDKFSIQTSSWEKPRPINIQVNQPVGISLKYGYGKFIFDTTVIDLKASASSRAKSATSAQSQATSSGTIVLAIPSQIEFVQRRSYFRVDVPSSLKVVVCLWRCGSIRRNHQTQPRYWEGKLSNISAGGAQLTVDAEEQQNFRKGQFVGLRFTPMPYETPLVFNAQIRNILPTADKKNLCLGVQIVGLEATQQGRQVLSRLVGIVERYYQINQSGAKQHDMHPMSF